MTLTHEAMLQDAIDKAALEIPLVVIGSVDKYKPKTPLENCELRIEDGDSCLNKINLRLTERDFQFLRQICHKFNDEYTNRCYNKEGQPATLHLFSY